MEKEAAEAQALGKSIDELLKVWRGRKRIQQLLTSVSDVFEPAAEVERTFDIGDGTPSDVKRAYRCFLLPPPPPPLLPIP